MVEHLATTARLDVQRKTRFSEQFHEDVVNLTYAVTSDIIIKSQTDLKVINTWAAFRSKPALESTCGCTHLGLNPRPWVHRKYFPSLQQHFLLIVSDLIP